MKKAQLRMKKEKRKACIATFFLYLEASKRAQKHPGSKQLLFFSFFSSSVHEKKMLPIQKSTQN